MSDYYLDPPTKPSREQYLSVGRFAQAALLTRKALRLYNQLGILIPDYTDPDSGYRYYSIGQLETAYYVRLLREMEVPLVEIRRVLAAPTTDDAMQLIIAHRQSFEEKVEQMRRSSHKVLAYLRKEQHPMAMDIEVKAFPSTQAVSITKKITVSAFHDFIPQALSQLESHLNAAGASSTGDPICFYYGPVNESDDGPVEICLPYTGTVNPSGDIVVREIPPHQGAMGTANADLSSYPTILDVWSEVVGWVQQNGFTIREETVGCYEIWHDDAISVVQPFEA